MPPAIQREECVRRIEERHVLEVEQRIGCVARVLLVIGVVGRCPQVPAAITRRTGGVGGILRLVTALPLEVDARGLTMRDRFNHLGQRCLTRQHHVAFGTGHVGIG